MKESVEKEVHVQVSVIDEKAHLMLLEAMYNIDVLDNASVDEVLEILKLSHKYDVKFVFKKCKYCLQVEVDSFDVCEKVMCFIKVDNTITDVEDLVSTLQSFLAKEFSPLDKSWQTTSFRKLCETSLRYLLSSDELVTASENTVFHALVSWIEEHGIDNIIETQGLPPLLSVVRFELIPIDYLYNIVQNNSVAKKLSGFSDYYLRGISYHALTQTLKTRLANQPVKRKACTNSIIPYTWIIPEDELAKLLDTDKTITSNFFWYCGYKIFLAIANVAKNKTSHGNLTFKAIVLLKICNLTEQSEVTIKWWPTCQSFTSHNPRKTRYTFEHKESSISYVDIECKMKIQQEPAELQSTASFLFGSGQTFGGTSLFGTSNVTSVSTASTFSLPSTSTLEASKCVSVSEQQSPNTPCLSIDVHIQLV